MGKKRSTDGDNKVLRLLLFIGLVTLNGPQLVTCSIKTVLLSGPLTERHGVFIYRELLLWYLKWDFFFLHLPNPFHTPNFKETMLLLIHHCFLLVTYTNQASVFIFRPPSWFHWGQHSGDNIVGIYTLL